MAIIADLFCNVLVYGDAKVYKNSYRMFALREWNKRTIEELDKISSTFDAKDDIGMRLAARLQVLSEAYYERYHEEHYGSEAVGRGQELQQRAYDLLRQGLGPWHIHTVNSLKRLCRWNIDAARRREVLKEAIPYARSHISRNHFKQGDLEKLNAMDSLVICCLRNKDYGEDVKALQMILVEKHSGRRQEMRVVNIYMGQRNWSAAADVASKLITDLENLCNDPNFIAECRAMLGEAQLMQGRRSQGETTLLAGMQIEQNSWKGIRILPCWENLIELYIKQARWKQAEELLLPLINAKTNDKGKRMRILGEDLTHVSWSRIDEMVGLIVGMDRWRAEESGRNMAVYHLLGLYKNKLQLALVYRQQRRLLEARQQLEALAELGLHKENRILEDTKELLVAIHLEMGNLDEAERIQEDIVKVIDEIFQPQEENVRIVPALQRLSDVYRRNNHWRKRHDVQMRLLKYR
ncbi:hypothetical protein CPB83DRAFT_861361 [Crepidotus variabilis]|uniref:Uncharacterized protein n=1 Tax=Crepidotus variabilis TaxID=179855 RepID=A0A9P6JL48_9AGAR|nr:hypothetical protein CPB83DRAFT_861361 [Crepidotus variabilis]